MQKHHLNSVNILVVDDEPEFQGMIKLKYRHEIESGIYRFYYAEDCESALSILRSDNHIDMMISDINQAENNGIEILEIIQKHHSSVKAVIVSDYGDMKNIRSAMNKGAYDFLIKPVDFNDLTATIEKTRKDVRDLKQSITTLEETEKDLQKTRAFYSAIVNSSLEAIIVFDKFGIIHDLNPAAEKLFGYSINEILGKNIGLLLTEIFPEGTDLNSDVPIIDSYIKSKIIGKLFETIAKHKDNTFIQVELVSTALQLGTDEFFTVMVRDITMRKRAEVLLREYNLTLESEVSNRTEELVKLNKEKNEILAIAAHDLKNPISNILMLAKNLNTGELNKDKVIEFSKDIITSSKKMLDLIKNLLDVNKIEQGKFEPELESFNIDFIIKSEIDSFKEYAVSKKIKLNYKQNYSVPDIFSDRNAIMQILNNLISNAIKFTPIGGEVNVVVESEEKRVMVKVIDNGPGISNNEQKKLFKKFSRLSTIPTAGENSTGLGLSIVKKLANLINCNVYYDSNTQNGATFVLELPLSK